MAGYPNVSELIVARVSRADGPLLHAMFTCLSWGWSFGAIIYVGCVWPVNVAVRRWRVVKGRVGSTRVDVVSFIYLQTVARAALYLVTCLFLFFQLDV